jgi:serine phosphatase RsbU (regulator of sigma subunit)/transcriptional regulator with GAF, ATPase, and Fis domain
LEKIIGLGNFVSANTKLSSIVNQIQKITTEMFNGRVRIWFSDDVFTCQVGGLAFSSLEKPGGDLTPLMHKAILGSNVLKETGDTGYAIAGPITYSGTLLGAILVDRNDYEFSRSETRIFKALLAQASVLIGATHFGLLSRWEAALLELTRKIGLQIERISMSDDFYIQCARIIREGFDYYHVAIYMFEQGTDILHLQGDATRDPEISFINRESPRPASLLGQGFIEELALSAIKPIGKRKIDHREANAPYYLPGTKKEYVLSLLENEQVIGLLVVRSDIDGDFPEIETTILQLLADQISNGIAVSKLINRYRNQVEQLSVVADISKAISSILDYEHLLNNIVSLIHKRFDIPRVNLYLANFAKNLIIYQTGVGSLPLSVDLAPNETSLSFDDQDKLIPWVFHNRKAALVNDIKTDQRCVNVPVGVESELVLPLIYGDKVLGILELQSFTTSAFKDEDLYIIGTLADYLSVAIRNANLYSTELWRRNVAESMRAIAGLLLTDIELENVLVKILQELHKILPCDISAIWLTEESTENVNNGLFPTLRLAALNRGSSSQITGMNFRVDLSGIDELLQLGEFPDSLSPWMLDALESDMPVIRTKNSPYEPIGSYLGFPDDYSAIAAPLRTGEFTLGLLVMIHHEPGRYGNESQAMTATFASYSAVAIKNARLYEAAHDQAWIATVMLQVSEATQSINSMQELSETVVRIIPRIIGVKACGLYFWDVDTESFSPGAFSSNVSETGLDFFRGVVSQGDIPAFDILIDTHAPVIINSDNFSSPIAFSMFNPWIITNQLCALFPMLSQGEQLGALLVNFSSLNGPMSKTEKHWDDIFSMIQGIANQTAVAIENIRLLQYQEEQAYISLALLQVAQAVVSLTNLDEILATIVRITPILVGVKRCVIYLCNPEKNEFSLSQSYGITRQELTNLPQHPSFEDHKFLNLIRQTGQISLILLSETYEETPISWSGYEICDFAFSPSLLTGDIDRQDLTGMDFLKYKGRILSGIPLIIKDEVLGIMITEEPEITKGIPAPHLRERRLEIIIGIAQQAALAIQNDRFQKEVMDRERMVREMQLARDIQTTFLPEEILQFPGWDIDIRWRPAYQVGGDFYDLIPLPNGCLCFVIADVADKGMPAALFMILVRTLIRATVKDTFSPAAILTQTNNLLVPDAKKGMFVTVLVAIISPRDGKVIYGNAGHNPPIFFHSGSKETEELLPTGMAIGVMEDIVIGEREIVMKPGDKLVFYTDGVTETFSPEGELFGSERLIKAIKTFPGKSAKSLINHIEAKLNHFIANGSPSDDLTLAAFVYNVKLES